MTHAPFVLIICDGWGYSPETHGNAIAAAATPHFDALWSHEPHTLIAASGSAVGLPEDQQGNSEVGHLTIGSGRIIRQPLSRQQHAIETGIFYQNEVLIEAIERARQNNSALHILGLVSPGGVHSHMEGALSLVRLAQKLDLANVHIHAFTDGRDTLPGSSLEHITMFEAELARIGTGRIASIAGRYYAMDRDNRWDRIQLAYEALVAGEHPIAKSAQAYIADAYTNHITDEFLRPVSIAETPEDRVHIKDGDSVVFFNFRPDRARQLSHALADSNFTGFTRRHVLRNLHFVSFTDYDPTLQARVAFPAEDVRHTLGEIVSTHGLRQVRIAETEKYAHVTYFLNGGREAAFPQENRIMVPSPQIATYDLQPAMSAQAVTAETLTQIRRRTSDVIIVNFANADMVGHTGDFEATKQAITILDTCLHHIISEVQKVSGTVLMTADHGNAEYKIDHATGQPLTAHTTNPVPVILCSADVHALRQTNSSLQDIAPTILSLMHLPIPAEMTGTSLVIE